MIKLGIIGSSDGNGHPFSWSAILNGYDQKEMKNSGYPVIYEYLKHRTYPDDFISNAKVVGVWTQDTMLSRKIAKASRIPRVVEHYTDFKGHVDGVLIARDDPWQRNNIVKYFLEHGIPVFVDKPLSCSMSEAQHLFDLQRYPGQLFTCSSLRYAKELHSTFALRPETLAKVHGMVPKKWSTYSVHAIEPMLQSLNWPKDLSFIGKKSDDCEATLDLKNIRYDYNIRVTASYKSENPITLIFERKTGEREVLTFTDPFSAFKESLEAFISGMLNKTTIIPTWHTLEVIRLIELGWVND